MSTDTDARGLPRIRHFDSDDRFDEEDESVDRSVGRRRRGTVRRAGVALTASAALVVLFGVLPISGFSFPLATQMLPGLYGVAESILNLVNVTAVLVVVAALTIVALVRRLPYGIGVVITVALGAPLTTALVRHWAEGWVPSSALPSGQMTAVVAVVAAASLVTAPKFLPAVGGLGALAAGVTAVAALVTGSVTVVGVLAAVLVSIVWWAGGSALMLYSPSASEREARNPLDTAAMAVQRRTGRFD